MQALWLSVQRNHPFTHEDLLPWWAMSARDHTYLIIPLSFHPTLRTCSADTILRAIKELTLDNIPYTSDTGKVYNFNAADTLNTLLLNSLLATGQLKEGGRMALTLTNSSLRQRSTMPTPHQEVLRLQAGRCRCWRLDCWHRERQGNANVSFHQKDTLKRYYERIECNIIAVNRFRADSGSCSEKIVEEVEKHSRSFYIRANRCSSL